MSSFLTHLSAGAVTACYQGTLPKKERLWTLWLLFLAISPDINYAAYVLFGEVGLFRYTHSLGFVAVLIFISVLGLVITKQGYIWRKTVQAGVAGGSHLVLDYLVGVMPKYFLWPFLDAPLRFSHGIFPSPGALRLGNPYLYVNLLLEIGIFGPPVWIYLLWKRKRGWKVLCVYTLLLAPLWIAALGISIHLDREI